MATTTLTGRLADPQFRQERAQKAARKRTSLAHHVQKVIDGAPSLPDQVVDELRQLLPPTGDDDREAA